MNLFKTVHDFHRNTLWTPEHHHTKPTLLYFRWLQIWWCHINDLNSWTQTTHTIHACTLYFFQHFDYKHTFIHLIQKTRKQYSNKTKKAADKPPTRTHNKQSLLFSAEFAIHICTLYVWLLPTKNIQFYNLETSSNTIYISIEAAAEYLISEHGWTSFMYST